MFMKSLKARRKEMTKNVALCQKMTKRFGNFSSYVLAQHGTNPKKDK